jgi:ABC-type multidrug transport system ATPase subunit
MPEGLALEFSGVTKRFGGITAVSDLTARVEPGQVTGFLGPNGAGKTTTLRVLLGLVQATAGSATIGGVPYRKLDRPLQTVGAVLEASSFHPGRTAANHLTVYAQAAGIPRSRVDEVLGLVGLGDAAGRKVGGFSLGMRQRLGLAYALLGDPGILVLDEPANGLDPEGIKWMRGFLRQLAREGRTVLTSSHLLAEVQQTVDSLLVISAGRLVFQGGLDELVDPSEYATVVDGPDRAALIAALHDAGVSFEVLRSGLTVRGLETVQVGAIAAAAGITLSSLHRRGPALEEVFLDLVNGTRVHPASGAALAPLITETVPPAPTAAAVAAVDEHADARDSVAQERADAAPAESTKDDVIEPVAPKPPVAAAGFAVASTGVIDIVGGDDDVRQPAAVETEVEALEPETAAVGPPAGEVLAAEEDAVSFEGGADEPDDSDEPEQSDRPWEEYVRTESDIEADAFFASFDAQQAAAAAAAERARIEGGGAAASDSEPAPPAEADPDQESEPDREGVPEADAGPHPGAVEEGNGEPMAGPEPESNPDPVTDPDPDPGPAPGEPADDTAEFGALEDLSPDWAEEEPADRNEGGEQR